MPLTFHTLDVFTENRFAGNPLAVVLGADDLIAANDVKRMQTIAREFNLAETVFVGPPRNPMNSARIRIFTPASELPFAGHPTVGTAVLLAELNGEGRARGPGGLTIALEEEIGLVRVDVSARAGKATRGVFSIPQLPERIEWRPDMAGISRALGLDALDIGFGAHGPTAWTAGVPFAFVPLKGLEAMAKVTIADAAAWQAAFGFTGRSAVYVYTRETHDPAAHVRARMFAPKLGVSEDPATGSAAAAFAGPAVLFERPEDGRHQLIIEQGYEMGRPSEIVLDLDVVGGLLRGASIGGAAVMVSEGTIRL
jgi:trans-2,3-dihydro-3-hydroxyanthranilate isomerase